MLWQGLSWTHAMCHGRGYPGLMALCYDRGYPGLMAVCHGRGYPGLFSPAAAFTQHLAESTWLSLLSLIVPPWRHRHWSIWDPRMQDAASSCLPLSHLQPHYAPLCFRVSPEASAGHKLPSAAHSDGNTKRKSSITSTLGLKKLLSALSHTPRPRLGTSRSYSVEQLQPSALAPHTSTSKVKRAPSLQILHLVSPQGPGQ